MSYRNHFITTGRLISIKKKNDKEVFITLISTSHTDVYPCIIAKKELVPELKKHAYIEIEGYAKGMYKEDSTYLPQRLYATSIKTPDTWLKKEFGAKGKFWEPQDSLLFISGVIEEVIDDTKYVRYIIQTSSPENDELVPIKLDWRKMDRHPEFKKGDKVCAICKIKTPKKMIGTEERMFLNLNVLDMDLLE